MEFESTKNKFNKDDGRVDFAVTEGNNEADDTG